MFPSNHDVTSASRRDFIKSVSLAGSVLSLPAARAQTPEKSPPQTALTGPQFALVGCGSRGKGVARMAQNFGPIVALCDVDEARLAAAKNEWPGATVDTDFRRLLERPGIDAVICGTVDHWHAMVSIAAMRAGKDVYCEKPLTLTFDEGERVIRARKETGRILQVGTQQRSEERFRKACDIVRSGLLGKLLKVEVVIPEGPRTFPFGPSEPPIGFHFDLWKGPTPDLEYIRERTHRTFRYWYEYSGGTMTDWGAHHMDIAVWGAGLEDSWPVAIRPQLLARPMDGSFTTPSRFIVDYEYADGLSVNFRSTPDSDFFGGRLVAEGDFHGIKFTGETGWIWVTRGEWKASDAQLFRSPLPEGYTPLPRSTHHMRNFVECIASREPPICPPEGGHRSAGTCHLGVIALRLDRALRFDPSNEQFVDDPEASALLSRSRRAPYDWSFIGET